MDNPSNCSRYPEYKSSGVEWLGNVPIHWNVTRLKRITHLLTEKTDRRSWPVALENIASWFGTFLETDADFSGEGVAFEAGDILFGKLRPYLAKVLLVDRPGEAVGDFHVMRLEPEATGRFVQYVLLNPGFISLVDGSTFGAKMPRASWDFMGGVEVSVPSRTEQTAIAALLDRETEKIDALVAEQEKLIALLKEKRQAVISHAVTKSLNPDAPMRPSGIEWLGDVPAHWNVVRIASLFREASDVGREDLPILSVSIHDGVSDKELEAEELDRKITRSDDRTKYKAVRPGDLAYNMMRAWQGGLERSLLTVRSALHTSLHGPSDWSALHSSSKYLGRRGQLKKCGDTPAALRISAFVCIGKSSRTSGSPFQVWPSRNLFLRRLQRRRTDSMNW
jgi:type I restriction enzyme, S subunit